MTSNMIAWRKAQEEVTHNREMERLQQEQVVEQERHNKAAEYETYRTNAANEAIKRQGNAINFMHYAMSDIFGVVLPELRGKSTSEVKLKTAQANQAEAQTGKLEAETELVRAETRHEDQLANYYGALTFKTHAETTKIINENALFPYTREKAIQEAAYYGARAANYDASSEKLLAEADLVRFNLGLAKWQAPANVVNTYVNTGVNLFTAGDRVKQEKYKAQGEKAKAKNAKSSGNQSLWVLNFVDHQTQINGGNRR